MPKARGLTLAQRLETRLAVLAEPLAEEMAKPASCRDRDSLRDHWRRFAGLKRPLLGSLRDVRADLRAARRANEGHVSPALRDIETDFKVIRKRAGLWPDMQRLVERHETPRRLPLIPRGHLRAADPLLLAVHQALHKLANPNAQADATAAAGFYADIPLPVDRFETLLRAAYRVLLAQGRARRARFLDVGAGGGTKVFLASRYFPCCDGIEYDAAYCAAARRTLDILSPQRCRVHQEDALGFERYGDYDVIYFYRPLRDDAALAALEKRILSQARPGAVILAPYTHFLAAREGFDCITLAEPVFVAGLDRAEARRLRQNAERTSREIIVRPADFHFDTGYWKPLLQAASFNGAIPAKARA